jgi:molybdenum cofactor guanylyltransferase
LSRAGFVLAGGRSSRMGRDKALLEVEGQCLAGRVAVVVREAAGSVTLIADPEKYGRLGYPVYPDRILDCGPLGGVYTALTVSDAAWNLVAACDMPDLKAPFLVRLLEAAENADCDCLLPAGPSGRPEPICAIYHIRSLAAIERALKGGVRRMLDGLAGLRLEVLQVEGHGPFRNINTPEEWTEYNRFQLDKTRERGN